MLGAGLAMLVIGPAGAIEFPEKYFLFNAYAVEPDELRNVEDSAVGFDIGFGLQLTEQIYAEARGFRVNFETGPVNRQAFYDSGFALDLQYLIGKRGDFSAFVVAGGGVSFYDVGNSAQDDTAYHASAGLGLLSRGLTSSKIRLRLEGRAIREGYGDGLDDVRVGLGLEIPLDPVEVVVREVPVQKVVERQGPPKSDTYPPRPIDSDGDGVLDNFDACKGTLPGTRVDRSGCAVPEQAVRLEGVQFELGSARLTPNSLHVLNQAAAAMHGQPTMQVVVAGHTDSLGDAKYNEKLSWARAQAVADYLIKNGVAATRLSVIGYGEDAPVASNESEAGRKQNRRVELEIRK